MMMQRNQLNGSRVCLYIADADTKYVWCFRALYFCSCGTQLYERKEDGGTVIICVSKNQHVWHIMRQHCHG